MGLAELTWSALDGFSRRLGIAPTSKTFAVALSGGPDSTALAQYLLPLRENEVSGTGARPVRGGEPQPEARERIGGGCGGGESMEDGPGANRAHPRFAFGKAGGRQEGRLLELMGAGLEHGGTCVLTAHNRSDQLETFVLRAMRASGVRGLAGIPPVSLLSLSAAGGGMRIAAVRGGGQESPARPRKGKFTRFVLSRAPKADLVDYREDNGLDYVSDPTNADLSYTRNAIRAHFGTVGRGRSVATSGP